MAVTADVEKVFDVETMITLVDPAGGEHECEVKTCEAFVPGGGSLWLDRYNMLLCNSSRSRPSPPARSPPCSFQCFPLECSATPYGDDATTESAVQRRAYTFY